SKNKQLVRKLIKLIHLTGVNVLKKVLENHWLYVSDLHSVGHLFEHLGKHRQLSSKHHFVATQFFLQFALANHQSDITEVAVFQKFAIACGRSIWGNVQQFLLFLIRHAIKFSRLGSNDLEHLKELKTKISKM